MKILGDRVLVALPPEPDEITTAGGLVLVRDPDRFHVPTQGIVVALGEKTGSVSLDDVLDVVTRHPGGEDFIGATAIAAAQALRPAIVKSLKALRPAPFDIQVNDCVIFSAAAGQEFDDGGITYVILREHEIIGVVEPRQKAVA